MIDKIVNHYVMSHLSSGGKTFPDNELRSIETGIRTKLLEEAYKIFKTDLLKKAQEQAEAEKQKILRKFKVTLIIETIFIAFLIGVIVNQVTNLIPNKWIISTSIIIVALLVCVLMVLLTLEKN